MLSKKRKRLQTTQRVTAVGASTRIPATQYRRSRIPKLAAIESIVAGAERARAGRHSGRTRTMRTVSRRHGLLAAMLVVPSFAANAQPVQVGGWESSGPELYQVNAVTAAPDDDRTVYAGSSIYEVSQSAVFVSTDSGRNWRALVEATAGDFFSEILVDPNDTRTIYAGASGNGVTNVYRTADGGATWPLVETVSPACSPSLAPVASSGTVLLACGAHLYRTRDAGSSWEALSAPFTEPTRLTAGAGNTLLAYGATRVFRGASDGGSWTQIANAPPACAGINVLREDAANPGAFFAGTGRLGGGGFQCGGVFRSGNGGATWTATNLSGVYVTDLALDPNNPSQVYAGAGYIAGILPRGGVYASSDGGATWRTLGLPNPGTLELSLSPSGGFLYAATSLGVFEHSFRKTRSVPPRGP
jgi:photosystem II stability/assembly factor-like uncharacterized protein